MYVCSTDDVPSENTVTASDATSTGGVRSLKCGLDVRYIIFNLMNMLTRLTDTGILPSPGLPQLGDLRAGRLLGDGDVRT
jgi:hypothetical protein